MLSKPHISYVETHLTDHCNLNCKGCGHFSPLAPETFADLRTFEKDLQELSAKLTFGTFRLMGGEPLLHPEIVGFTKAARKYLPDAEIAIVTNGIKLPQMDETFWHALKENNVKIHLSKYPTLPDFTALLKSKNVVFEVTDYSYFSQALNFEGNFDIIASHKNCKINICHNLRSSKLYACPLIYAGYFSNDITLPEPIDFYKLTGAEIKKALEKPQIACKYCDTYNPRIFKWERNDKNNRP
jgi:molybdenum cofactor biosynthesis enzyme MoaA